MTKTWVFDGRCQQVLDGFQTVLADGGEAKVLHRQRLGLAEAEPVTGGAINKRASLGGSGSQKHNQFGRIGTTWQK